MEKSINIVFIGRYSFPKGVAMTKRHRYYIDYLSKLPNVAVCNICTWGGAVTQNDTHGMYNGVVEYYNTDMPRKATSFLPIANWANKILRDRYKPDADNVAIFCAYVTLEQLLIFKEAMSLGYKVICDVVENYSAVGGDASKAANFAFSLNKLFLYKKVSGFIVISSQINEAYKPYLKPILELTNSAPITCSEKKKSFHSPMKILYSGTFASKDGLKYLIGGFEKFIRERGEVAELILTGKGVRDSGIEAKIKNNKQIIKLGYLSDEELTAQQLSADVLCMTRCNSLFANSGFPFKLSEYLATGNTVLATAVGDVSRYIQDKVNGLLIVPESADAICDALTYAYTHEKECIEMGIKGIETVDRYFNVESNGRQLYQFIKHICEV